MPRCKHLAGFLLVVHKINNKGKKMGQAEHKSGLLMVTEKKYFEVINLTQSKLSKKGNIVWIARKSGQLDFRLQLHK